MRRKYHRLFSGRNKGKPGPKGPSQALIDAIVEMKRRNPRFGCPKIAQQISKAFSIEIDKDVVRRVLAKYYCSNPGNNGPSWLTFIGHMKDSLWSVDLFCCESIILKTHWVLVYAAPNPRLFAAVEPQIENHSIMNAAYSAADFAHGSILTQVRKDDIWPENRYGRCSRGDRHSANQDLTVRR